MEPAKSAEARRAEIQAHAASLGIDDAYISTLVDSFYTRVRAHPLLGPIFENAIDDDEWAPHLARMKDFWASVALNAGRYSGKPVPKHVALLPDVDPVHFNLWLGLFQATLADTAPSPEAADYFMERAQRIAQSLKLAMFGLPSLNEARAKPQAAPC